MPSVDNKRIAKNTLFLYFRMFIIMGVTLYTARVVLDVLGADDYGIYNVVGGVVAMLGFLNGTLSTGTSRFITFELGRGDTDRLKRTFSTAFYVHVILAIIILLLMETGGLWFLHNKLQIPQERMFAASVAFQISIVTTLLSITQVPYTAAVMAHERMGIYAYVSIFEALGKLGVVYLLSIAQYDKLIFYAALIGVLQLLVMLYYRYYCAFNFQESRLTLTFDKGIAKELMGFSGWNVIANLSNTLGIQGKLIVLNMFFQPSIVAAQAVGTQISSAMMQFVTNFRTAINPPIIKAYAAQQYEESKKLTLRSAQLVFDMILLLSLPILLVLDKILEIWLVEVPPYTLIFAQLIIIKNILDSFNSAYYIPMMAAGKLKKNAIAAIFFGPGTFIILYFIFYFGGSVLWTQYMAIISVVAYSFIIKPYILVKDVQGYKWSDFIPYYLMFFKVAISSTALSLLFYWLIPDVNLLTSVIVFLCSLFSVTFCAYIFLDKGSKAFVDGKVKKIVKKIRLR